MANQYFNAAYYLENNPDVVAAGYTLETAEEHYLRYGANEAFKNADAIGKDQRKPAPWFDVQYYLSINPDLELNGVTPFTAFQHFTTYGIHEGRSPMKGVLLNDATLSAYASANPDLLRAFGISNSDNLLDFQQSALVNHFYTHGYLEDRPAALATPWIPDALTITLEAQGWTPATNSVSFILEFASEIQLSDIHLLGGGAIFLSSQASTVAGITTVTAQMSLSNGKPAGSIGIDLLVPSTLQGKATVAIKDFTINRTEYPDVSSTDGARIIEFKFADLLNDFTEINESLHLDSSGYETNYSHINNVFSLPASKAGVIETGSVVQAYLHIDQGEKFAFDYDTFVLRPDSNANYRLKFSPEDPTLFNSNIISWLYDADGSVDTLTMNLIGGTSSFIDGSLYSDSFALRAGEDKFLSLAMRWRSDDVWAVAEGPAGYRVELVKLVGVEPADLLL